MSLKVTDRLPQFATSARRVLDDALKEGARDVIIAAKDKAPFDKGGLRAESDVKKNKPLLWRISFWSEYARFQEFGGDSKRKVRNYKTSGTGKHYLKSAGDMVATKINMTFKKHGHRARP